MPWRHLQTNQGLQHINPKPRWFFHIKTKGAITKIATNHGKQEQQPIYKPENKVCQQRVIQDFWAQPQTFLPGSLPTRTYASVVGDGILAHLQNVWAGVNGVWQQSNHFGGYMGICCFECFDPLLHHGRISNQIILSQLPLNGWGSVSPSRRTGSEWHVGLSPVRHMSGWEVRLEQQVAIEHNEQRQLLQQWLVPETILWTHSDFVALPITTLQGFPWLKSNYMEQ